MCQHKSEQKCMQSLGFKEWMKEILGKKYACVGR